MRRVLLLFLFAVVIATSSEFMVHNSVWENYKATHRKTYANFILDKIRHYIYSVNTLVIEHNNELFQQNLVPFRLGINQYTDLRVLEYAALFPPTIDVQYIGVPYTLPTAAPQPSFLYAAQGFESPVQNQGLVCNSGWAYATATALQIYDASITGNLNSQLLSAQNLVDCAGGAKACRNQVPQTAFDYLTKQFQKLYPQSEYPNNPFGTQGTCAVPVASTIGKGLKSYTNIANVNNEVLKAIVNYVSPVIIKINPATFEFMHYKEGVFTQPKPTQNAAHYITIVGYELDSKSGKQVWLAQNSFGTTWGEAGIIRIEIDPAKPIGLSATFPTE